MKAIAVEMRAFAHSGTVVGKGQMLAGKRKRVGAGSLELAESRARPLVPEQPRLPVFRSHSLSDR